MSLQNISDVLVKYLELSDSDKASFRQLIKVPLTDVNIPPYTHTPCPPKYPSGSPFAQSLPKTLLPREHYL